ncbi:competence protein ComEC [Salinibacterium amurskyense]|uniref:Competence protein ComEC n=1 Tax=Salinibacterium amurskyense TaxID=205941 RepID=A0A2M9D8W0_9MICO|nr:ComEC/Rec2 family competence protein [Salinibacterium amurskyense]PJJ82157.1 competence protein ComEC [Salinibacterium amurskyense]RLQ81934.1 ComEC/Rec2 family competence protein [Salinibacterium amurskyense]GHD77963.1 membrane protein [Salinibacterium amurskyense]
MNLDLRLSLPVAAAWLVAVVVIGVPAWTPAVAIALWLATGALIAGALLSQQRFLASVALGCALAALCSTSVAVHAETRQPLALGELAAKHTTVTAIATTTSAVKDSADFFQAIITTLEADGESIQLESPALIFTERGGFGAVDAEPDEPQPGLDASDADGEPWGIGVTFAVTGTLASTSPEDGRAVLLFATDPPEWRADPGWQFDWANQLRRTFAAATSSLPGGGGELLGGLAIGDTSAVSDDLDAAMKTSSLSHLTAVSGANCAIVVGLIMALGGRVGAHRILRIGLSILILLAFVVVVTPDPSVLRAALMATFVLIALGSGRPIRGMAVLSLATIALLVFDPWLSRNFAFVLSVFATAGLLLFAEPLAQFLARWMPRSLSLVIAVPLAAQLACQPVLLLLQPSLPTYGVIANVLAAPAAPIATVVGLAACVALSVIPVLGLALMWVAWVPSAWVAAVADFFAEAPWARIPWWEGWVGVLTLSVLTVLLLAALVIRGAWRTHALTSLAIASTLALAVVAGSAVSAALTWPRDWQFAQCDVGQGDAVVLRSGEEVALIDTGAEPDLLKACLDRLSIDHIDLLILTHFDHDHVGGTEAVVGRADVVLVGPTGSPSDEALLGSLAAGGAQVHPVSAGDRGQFGEQQWRVLWPPAQRSGIDPGNDASVVVEFLPRSDCLRHCLSSVFLGDLGESAQARLGAASTFRQVDVVKVSHHGSGDQYPALYAELQATLGLIGVGADNGYGHPTADALAMLDDAGTAVARSDLNGLILVSSGVRAGVISLWSESAEVRFP